MLNIISRFVLTMVSYCSDCQKEFKNPGSLATHKYRSHSASNKGQLVQNTSNTQYGPSICTIDQSRHSLDVADKGASVSMQNVNAEIVMIREDLAKLKESHASIIEALNDFWRKLENNSKVLKTMQRDVYR